MNPSPSNCRTLAMTSSRQASQISRACSALSPESDGPACIPRWFVPHSNGTNGCSSTRSSIFAVGIARLLAAFRLKIYAC